MTHYTRRFSAEHRWPSVVAVLVAVALVVTLPATVHPHLRLAIAGVELLGLVVLVAVNPVHLTREPRWSRVLARGESILLVLAALASIAGTIVLLAHGDDDDGPRLLLAALQAWVALVISFAVLAWHLDRGGPVHRRDDSEAGGLQGLRIDLRFAQDEAPTGSRRAGPHPGSVRSWAPTFTDYLLFSLTAATAVVPGQTVPLSTRAKLLCALESFAGYVLIGMVIARAVALLA
ncbi:hypothetical protein [Frondihabitans sp. PAMC 28766]|uniref:hypothetical protein n=1 Tax=Frondihabitans sp. PAMC 28766 TaxID=1795630 RepID=UPI0012FF6F30|nr:hypothetical protein [Frondihabitans sp. PAMC 28766]